MARKWYIKQAGKLRGPYESSRLKQFIANGKVDRNAEVANSSDGPWHSVSRIKGIQFPGPGEEHPAPPQDVNESKSVVPGESGEQFVWSGHPSQITNLRKFLVSGLFAILLLIFSIKLDWRISLGLLIPIISAVWSWLTVWSINYELTSERLRITRGVLSRIADELELFRVKDISFQQSVFRRVFRLATLTLTTSDQSTPIVEIDSISAAQARELREQIRTFTQALRDQKGVREVDYN